MIMLMMQMVVKEEDDMVDSQDILAQINGMNSFKYNYPNYHPILDLI